MDGSKSTNDYGTLKTKDMESVHESDKDAIVTIDNHDENNQDIPQEPLKTVISGLFLCSGFLATTISTSLTHDYVPTNITALPDFILDDVTYQHWGLYVSEIFLVVNVLFAFIVVLFHAFRIIILR